MIYELAMPTQFNLSISGVSLGYRTHLHASRVQTNLENFISSHDEYASNKEPESPKAFE